MLMSSLELSIVCALAKNRVIGRDNQLPWRLPADLAYFKKLTLGHPVIMGRRTWESLKGPLPQRENIVVTRTAGYEAPGAAVASSRTSTSLTTPSRSRPRGRGRSRRAAIDGLLLGAQEPASGGDEARDREQGEAHRARGAPKLTRASPSGAP